MNIGTENPNNLNIQVLDDLVCTILRSFLEGATILWKQVTCSSVVPSHKVTIITVNFSTQVVTSLQEQPN